jgi:hypothetical protein
MQHKFKTADNALNPSTHFSLCRSTPSSFQAPVDQSRLNCCTTLIRILLLLLSAAAVLASGRAKQCSTWNLLVPSSLLIAGSSAGPAVSVRRRQEHPQHHQSAPCNKHLSSSATSHLLLSG